MLRHQGMATRVMQKVLIPVVSHLAAREIERFSFALGVCGKGRRMLAFAAAQRDIASHNRRKISRKFSEWQIISHRQELDEVSETVLRGKSGLDDADKRRLTGLQKSSADG